MTLVDLHPFVSKAHGRESRLTSAQQLSQLWRTRPDLEPFLAGNHEMPIPLTPPLPFPSRWRRAVRPASLAFTFPRRQGVISDPGRTGKWYGFGETDRGGVRDGRRGDCVASEVHVGGV